jgi:hypothetical protein
MSARSSSRRDPAPFVHNDLQTTSLVPRLLVNRGNMTDRTKAWKWDDYPRLLLRERKEKLRDLALQDQQGLISRADYCGCRRSLLQAINELETLLDESQKKSKDKEPTISGAQLSRKGLICHRGT